MAFLHRYLWCLLMLMVCTTVYAQSGFMRNISANGLLIEDADISIAQIACTIIDQADVALILFAEATDSDTDPLLALVELVDGREELLAQNDNWRDLSTQDQAFISNTLRAPGRATDAALWGVAAPGSYCAFAFQVGDAEVGSVNLQITDVSEALQNKRLPARFQPNPDPAVEAMIRRARRGLPPLQP